MFAIFSARLENTRIILKPIQVSPTLSSVLKAKVRRDQNHHAHVSKYKNEEKTGQNGQKLLNKWSKLGQNVCDFFHIHAHVKNMAHGDLSDDDDDDDDKNVNIMILKHFDYFRASRSASLRR